MREQLGFKERIVFNSAITGGALKSTISCKGFNVETNEARVSNTDEPIIRFVLN